MVGVLPVTGQGLVLREWTSADAARMLELFDTGEIDRWTPLPYPFDAAAAREYLHQAHRARSQGTLQLAITHEGGIALGEVLLFPTDRSMARLPVNLRSPMGRAHRGQRLAAQAVRALIPTAQSAGYQAAQLMIATANQASQHTAVAAVFTREPVPLQPRERKGYTLRMATWTRSLG